MLEVNDVYKLLNEKDKLCDKETKEYLEMKNRIQLRLGCVNESKRIIYNEITRLNDFCYHCNEDRIFCPMCVIPLTVRKLNGVYP